MIIATPLWRGPLLLAPNVVGIKLFGNFVQSTYMTTVLHYFNSLTLLYSAWAVEGSKLWQKFQWKLNYDPYAVVLLNMCLCPQEYALPLQLPSGYLSWKWGNPDSVHLVHCSLASTCTMHLRASNQLAVQKLCGDLIWQWRTKLSNWQINITTDFPVTYMAQQGRGTEI